MKKRTLYKNTFGKLILCFGIALMIGGLWYLMHNEYVIIKW
jgi:hypothetical protein